MYLEWLEEQKWLESYNLKMFGMDGTLFRKFVNQREKIEGVSPLTEQMTDD